MSLGVNVDFRYPESFPSLIDAKRYGVRMARCISLPEMESWGLAYLNAGIQVIAIYTGESDAAGRYVMRNCSALQVGNEPQFAMDGAASWPTGSADDFVNVWSHVANVLVPAVHPAGFPLVGPGIWCQDYAKWSEVAHYLPGLSAAAVHVYPEASGQSAAQVRSYLSLYRNVRADLPLLCTEWSMRGPGALSIARAIDSYCDERLWYAWLGEGDHALNGTPELGVLALAR